MFFGDFFQLPPVIGYPFYNEDYSNKTIATPHDSGCSLIAKLKMFTLTHQFRSKDPDHTARINRMRQTDIEDPVDDNLLNSFKVLTKEDIANDPSWKTAPVVVCSNDERHSLNMLI